VENKNLKKIVMKISELPFLESQLAQLRQKECECYYHSKNTDDLWQAFDWNETKEGNDYWLKLHDAKPILKETLMEKMTRVKTIKEEPKHYDNSRGSLYKFCNDHGLNSYEFDIIKRVMRCRKKGLFLEDLEKTKFAIDLYIKEQLEINK
jgi:hypothetical protein